MRVLLVVTLCLASLWSWAQPRSDKLGCSDPAGISRYQGSIIFACRASEFDAVRFLNKPVAAISEQPRTDSNSVAAEGRYSGVAYVGPKGRSSREVFANYREALSKAGFAIDFTCDDATCGSTGFATMATKPFGQSVPYELFSNATVRQYLFARLPRAEGDVLASVFVSQNKGKPSWGEPASILVEVVEVRPMDTGKVLVNAEALRGGLEREGKVALYGIYFETGQALVKPESKPQLVEIAALLEKQPTLNVLIVGHTDATGDEEANLALSTRRAQAVVEALTKAHAVDGKRLKAVGVGMAAPVASNASEAGRARNRRVELVQRLK
jgi:OmpA-OmpF porin, OOP family